MWTLFQIKFHVKFKQMERRFFKSTIAKISITRYNDMWWILNNIILQIEMFEEDFTTNKTWENFKILLSPHVFSRFVLSNIFYQAITSSNIGWHTKGNAINIYHIHRRNKKLIMVCKKMYITKKFCNVPATLENT